MLSQVLKPPRRAPIRFRRPLSSGPVDPSLKSVAVLGGGISGLSAAYYLAKLAPDVPVTLYEKSDRLGGWLYSKKVEYAPGRSVVFEQGPRTLRPWSINGLATIDLIRRLGIEDEMLIIPKTSPAAKNRYIYYPDQLNALPSSIVTAVASFKLPVMKGVIGGLFPEAFRPRRDPSVADETVGSFVTRRVNASVAQNVVSAVLHGIYAGDVDELSARSLFPKQWRDEALHGSMTLGALKDSAKREEDIALRKELYEPNKSLLTRIKKASVYSFHGGIETLSRALVAALSAAPNVTIRTSTPIDTITYTPGPRLPLSIAGTSHSHLISTLLAPTLHPLLPASSRPPELAAISAVTVMVVNLYFASPPSVLLPVQGFGYLLPKSLPASQNPHSALGVIFDSCSTPSPAEPGTKLTVMFGGHHWRPRSDYPDSASATEMARDVVAQHLKIHEAPVAVNVSVQRNCIPQYTVGHEQRLLAIREGLGRYNGRVAVAGNSYRGVGLNDCVRYSRDCVVRMVREGKANGLEGCDGAWVEDLAVE